jgi:hypothetical protein
MKTVYNFEKREEYGLKFLEVIRQIRELRNQVDSPALESCLREMEYANYFALIYLGMEDGASPETWDELVLQEKS